MERRGAKEEGSEEGREDVRIYCQELSARSICDEERGAKMKLVHLRVPMIPLLPDSSTNYRPKIRQFWWSLLKKYRPSTYLGVSAEPATSN